jgi:hypothetical protein
MKASQWCERAEKEKKEHKKETIGYGDFCVNNFSVFSQNP